jgi:enoyl-[acyl-carrier protein] reductase III
MEITSGKKWAVVLGASGGMGWAIVQRLAKEGFSILGVIRERRQQEMYWQQEAQSCAKTHGVEVIFQNEDGIREAAVNGLVQLLAEKAGPHGVSVFVHALAKGNLKSLAAEEDQRMSTADLMLTFEAMAASWWTWTSALYAAGVCDKGMLNLGLTSAGSQRVWPYYGAVGTTKAALEQLAASMAVELGPKGIRTNVIQPGITQTKALEMIPGAEQLVDFAKKNNPMGRLTLPEDVANVVYLLTTKDAAFINGAVITVDGGESLC